MKKLQRKFFIFCIFYTMSISGCKWNSELYDWFVDDEEHIESCSIGTKADLTKGGQNGGYIEYYSNSDADSIQRTLIQCRYKDCPSAAECCGIASSVLRRKFYHAFKYGICPEEMRCVSDQQSQFVPYCTEAEACPLGEHFNREEKKCEIDSAESCNGIDCTKTEGWESGYCNLELLTCQATQCKDNYHFNTRSDASSIEAKLCEYNDDINCGSHGNACDNFEKNLDKQDMENYGVEYKRCIDGVCKPTMCAENFHWARGRQNCEKNSEKACDYYKNDCTLLDGWDEGTCALDEKTMEYSCAASKCTRGYHLTALGRCEADNNEHCGSPSETCETNSFCAYDNDEKKYRCLSACTNGMSICYNLGCFDLNTDVNHCGSCGTRCANDKADAMKCVGGRCIPTSCIINYHLETQEGMTECVKDTDEHCGDVNKQCNKDIDANTEETCIEGVCVSGCKEKAYQCGDKCFSEEELYQYGLYAEEGVCKCKESYYSCGQFINGLPLCIYQGDGWDSADWEKYHGNCCDRCKSLGSGCNLTEIHQGKSGGYDVTCADSALYPTVNTVED